MSSALIGAFLAGLLAAVGNAIYVYGQRKAGPAPNPFLMTTALLSLCWVICVAFLPFFGVGGMGRYLRDNWGWALVAGGGLFLVYVGFYWLFGRYGASYYTLYAALSILTTSIFLGKVVLREPFNGWYWLSTLCALAAVAFFALGKSRG